MRLLVVNWQDRENPDAGGAEQHLHEIFGRLAGRGHDVTLLCSGWDGAPSRVRLDGMDVHRVGTRFTFPLHAYPYYRRYLAAAKHDVLVEDINKIPLYTPQWGARRVLTVVPHLFGTTAFEVSPVPVAAVVWAAELPLRSMYGRLPFEAISESTADDLVARGIPRSAIRVIYCGIDSHRFTPDPLARSPRPLIAYLGRLKKYKGVDVVLRAFAEVERVDATLEIAGTGDHRPALEKLARSLDLGDRVKFLGFVSESEKLALLRRAWVLALASPKEGWGITNLEAAACATPVVASDSPGIRESVRDGETGFLVPHGDVGAMSRALARITQSPALVQSLGENGRRFAATFTWDRAADQTEAHLQELVMGG